MTPRPRGLAEIRRLIATSGPGEAYRESLRRARESADLGAFLCLADDDAEARDGPRTTGALAGVPVAVKDNLDTADLPTTGGTPALARSRPGRDHPAVARVRAAGAAVLGKTNLHELALGVTSNNAALGPVRNPHDASRSAGGSSGGSAAAVAAGIVPLALGSDTGGSVRIPAAHCGTVGFRPTVGRWGSGSAVPLSSTRDTAGGLASTVADVALLDRVATGTEALPMPVRAPRLGVPTGGFYDGLHPEVANRAGRSLDRLADAGAELVEVRFAEAQELDGECGFPIVFFETARELPRYLASLPGPERNLTLADVLEQVASPDVRLALEASVQGAGSVAAYRQALQVRDRLRHAYAGALTAGEDGRLDALVYPTVPLPAPPIGDDETTELNGRQVPVFLTTIRNTSPGATAGMPSLSLPAGATSTGLPVGMSLEALPGEDANLLATAAWVEQVLAGAE